MVAIMKNFQPIVIGKKDVISKKDSQLVVKEYKQKGNEILSKMIKVLMRAQRKVDDSVYRKTLEKMQKEKL